MDTINEEGWIKLHRKSIYSQVFQSEGLWKVWTWCLLRANHEDTWIPVRTGRGSTQVLVRRGQFIFGRKTAAKVLKMKEPTVQKRMMLLRNLQNIIIQSNSHYSIITVCNYDLYQGYINDVVSSKVSGKYQASITDKNVKNEKNIGRSSKKQDADPRVKEFQNYWSQTFFREIGQPYTFSYGKEGNLIKGLLQVHPFETLQDVTRLFFKDEECRRRGLTIGIFFQEINRLLSQKAMNPLEQAKREARQ